ncbi:MAG: hypothetical protein KDB57_04405 [Solirubrobacterales bacterium]|nr:hypothetical protein [Solirubrobacterales bacterium]
MLTLRRKQRADDPYSAGVPYLAGTIIGVREWRGSGNLGPMFIAAEEFEWKSDGGATEARCARGHDAPAPSCECGLYAYHPWSVPGRVLLERSGRSGASVRGLVAAWGKVEVHGDGFRAQYAKPVAFIHEPGAAASEDLQELAGRCEAELIDAGRVEAWLEQNAGVLPDSSVSRMLSLGRVRQPSRQWVNWGRLEDAMVWPFKIVGYTLFGLMMFFSFAIQVLWWGFVAYLMVMVITGFDPIGLEESGQPDPPRQAVPADKGWHPPMNR